jgi:hypothetical protein
MTVIERIPCPYCHTLNLPQEVVCPNCGKPVRAALEKTVVMSAPRRDLDGRHKPLRQGLNGRQKAFVWRYLLPLALFVPLYILLVLLLKMPSVSVIDWLVKPLYRPFPGGLSVQPFPGWVLVAVVDGVITAFIVRLIKPPTWEDLEKPDFKRR